MESFMLMGCLLVVEPSPPSRKHRHRGSDDKQQCWRELRSIHNRSIKW